MTRREANRLRSSAWTREKAAEKLEDEARVLRQRAAKSNCPFEPGDIVIGGKDRKIKMTVTGIVATSPRDKEPWKLVGNAWTKRNKPGKLTEVLHFPRTIRISSPEERLKP